MSLRDGDQSEGLCTPSSVGGKAQMTQWLLVTSVRLAASWVYCSLCQSSGDSRGSPDPPWSPSPSLIIWPVVFLTSDRFRQSDYFYFISNLNKFDKKCIHIKLQVDSPSGHCSQLEFYSPPEVQQITLLAQVQHSL